VQSAILPRRYFYKLVAGAPTQVQAQWLRKNVYKLQASSLAVIRNQLVDSKVVMSKYNRIATH